MEIHISDYFSEEEISCLSQEADRSEELGKLTSSAIDILNEKQLLDLFVPQQYGGLQCNLPEALPWIETTSWIDGSLGWTLTLTSGAGLFGAFMEPEFARSVFDQQNMFIAGSGFPGGKAENKDSEFEVNGMWKYASGIDHATLITATCYLIRNGKILHKDSKPNTKAMAFYPDEVEVIQRWNSMGLKATGSHNFQVQDVQIPEERTFIISPDSVQVDGLLYQYPFDAFAHCTLSISMLGIARRFLDEAKRMLLSKNDVTQLDKLSKSLQTAFQDSYLQFRKAKKNVYKTVNKSWQKLQISNRLDNKTANKVATQSRKSCEIALNCVQHIYPLLGMSAINPNTTINRCWRDLHTASQHMFLKPQQ